MLDADLGDTSLTWVGLSLDVDPPLSTASARCGVAAAPGYAVDAEVYFDNVVLRERPLFADGFEDGDLLQWSVAVP